MRGETDTGETDVKREMRRQKGEMRDKGEKTET